MIIPNVKMYNIRPEMQYTDSEGHNALDRIVLLRQEIKKAHERVVDIQDQEELQRLGALIIRYNDMFEEPDAYSKHTNYGLAWNALNFQNQAHELSSSTVKTPSGTKTDPSTTGYRLLPPLALKRIAAIYVEGLRYGEHNWTNGGNDVTFIKERLEHALAHLYKWLANDRSEDHLAKVAWFCLMMLHFDEESNVFEGLEDTAAVRLMSGDAEWDQLFSVESNQVKQEQGEKERTS